MTNHVAEMDVLIPAEAMEGVDLTIPDASAVELAATQMTQYLYAYHRLSVEQTSARHNEDQKQGEDIAKQMVFCRNVVAMLQFNHPSAKAIADKIMTAEARQAQKGRERVAQ